MTKSSMAVIVVNWNSDQYLEKCLDALICQTVLPSRIIVFDNKSNSFDVKLWEKQFPSVEFHPLVKNIGFAAASNMGATIASDCQWLAFLNPDAFPELNWIEILVNAIYANPEFNFFSSLIVSDLKPNLIDGAGEVYHSCGLAWRRDHLTQLVDFAMEKEEVFGACGGAALISRKAFMDAGGYDESFFCYFEDVDLSFRLRLLGGHCLFLPEAKVRHVGNGSTSQWSDFAVYYGHRNMILTYFKNMPGFLFWYYLPQHLLLNLFSLLWCAKRGQGRVVLRSKWDAIKNLPTIYKARKSIQKRKIVSTSLINKMLSRCFTKHHHLNNLKINKKKCQ